MSEPKRIQVIRSHPNINESIYQKDQKFENNLSLYICNLKVIFMRITVCTLTYVVRNISR